MEGERQLPAFRGASIGDTRHDSWLVALGRIARRGTMTKLVLVIARRCATLLKRLLSLVRAEKSSPLSGSVITNEDPNLSGSDMQDNTDPLSSTKPVLKWH